MAAKIQRIEEVATRTEQEVKTESSVCATMEQVLEELSKVAFQPADDGTGSSIKYTSKLRALELLAKHLEQRERNQEEEELCVDDPVTQSIKEAVEHGLF